MNCKNCGAKISDNAKMCPNCGVMINEDEGYILLTADDDYYDYTKDGAQKPKKKGSGLRWFISILLTLAIVGGGAYYYFNNIYQQEQEVPPVSFDGGAGIINGDEKIVYVTIDNPSNIEYIHGVTLYDEGRHTDDGALRIYDRYEYTKSINDSFRAIFVDLDDVSETSDFELQPSNRFTFKILFSFSGDDEIFEYTKTVSFTDDISDDVSDIIFDHSVDGTTKADEKKDTEKTSDDKDDKKETTTEKEVKTNAAPDFIYEGYWYGEPNKDGDTYTIYAYKFSKGGKYTATKYSKKGGADWKVTSDSGSFELSDYALALDDEEYLIDSENESLEAENGNKLTARKYNSVKNAEDFFGI